MNALTSTLHGIVYKADKITEHFWMDYSHPGLGQACHNCLTTSLTIFNKTTQEKICAFHNNCFKKSHMFMFQHIIVLYYIISVISNCLFCFIMLLYIILIHNLQCLFFCVYFIFYLIMLYYINMLALVFILYLPSFPWCIQFLLSKVIE